MSREISNDEQKDRAQTSHLPRVPLTRQRILATAMHIADAGGVEALSMRKLASEFGVKAMSLYNHVDNKDDIIAGIVDEVVGEIQMPQIDGVWKPEMRKRALSAHDVLVAHPWATVCLVSGKNAGPHMLTYVNATIGCLLNAGFSYEISDRIWNAMDSYIYGYTLQELNFPFEVSEYADAAKDFLPQISAERYPYFSGLAERIMRGEITGVHDFEFGFDLLLDGLERYLSREQTSQAEEES